MSDEVTPKTNYQNRRIWGMANQLALEEELLRDVVEEITGQRRISALSFDQAHDVIMALTRQLNKVRQGHRRMGAPSDRVSQNQLRAIMILRVRRGWDIWQLRSWMKRSFGVQREEWLTNKIASKVIQGLQAMCDRGDQSDHATARS